VLALPGIVGLIVFIYVRPHEFFEPLRNLNFLYGFLLLAVVGVAADLARGRTVPMATPHLAFVVAFALWCLLTLGLRKPGELVQRGPYLLTACVLYLVIASATQHVESLKKVVTVVFACGLFVAFVGAHQGVSPFQCCVYDPAEKTSMSVPDGRECAMEDADGAPHDGSLECIASGKPGIPYQCERAGLFGTTSVGGGRVRYLGVLLDPNELALATALAVPFAFAFLEMRRSVLRVALLLATIVVVGMEVVFTHSRGGQMTLGVVLGAYFVKRFGAKRGLIVAALLAVPIVLYGGRADSSADESTLERLTCACAGIKMLMSSPLRGVGYSLFLDHHFLTAHNAYILAAGELGLVGMCLFGILVYLALKIPASVLRSAALVGADARPLRALAMALLAAMIGASVGIFFLSWTYHSVLWIHFGLCGALYACTKRRFPAYGLRLSGREALGIFVSYAAFIAFWAQYIKWKGAWE
jgi:hypothetical protein